MAYSKTPTAHWSGYSSDGTNMTLPLAAFPQISTAEAHTSTGDHRNILYGILHQAYADYNAAETADKPTKMTVRKSTSVNDATGVTTVTFSLEFKMDGGPTNVSAE